MLSASGVATAGGVAVLEVGELPAYAEWQRMQAVGSAESGFLPTAWRACEELLAHGRPADAEQVAMTALLLARRRVAQAPTPSALRDLSISLDNVGRVARAQGDWPQAEAVYRESLDLRRQLVERLGGTPEALRDLSVSLDNVGRVARAQGDWSQAKAAYRESLGLRRQLVERLVGTPEALEDLASSLLNVAEVSPGNAAMRGEAIQLYETLARGFPGDPRYSKRLASLRGDNPDPTQSEAEPAP